MKADVICPACASPWDGRLEKVAGFSTLICPSCGLYFCEAAELADVDYDAIYRSINYVEDQVDSIDRVQDWKVFAAIPTYQPFFTTVSHFPGAKLLDVGCGVGRFCRAAAVNGWDATGIDISRTAIAKGKETATFPMYNCTAEEMVARNEVFDAVTAFEVLEHLRTPKDLLKSVQELLRPGGKFFCTVPNWESPTVRGSNRADWIPPVHVLFFNAQALRELLIQSGLKNVQTGMISINMPPKRGLLKLGKYYFDRLTGKIGKPDPLGLWAVGEK